MKKPAYRLNDAPRRRWNILDSARRSYGVVPNREDRCAYVYYREKIAKPTKQASEVHPNGFSLPLVISRVQSQEGRQVHGFRGQE